MPLTWTMGNVCVAERRGAACDEHFKALSLETLTSQISQGVKRFWLIEQVRDYMGEEGTCGSHIKRNNQDDKLSKLQGEKK